jgi:hypothetical protein
MVAFPVSASVVGAVHEKSMEVRERDVQVRLVMAAGRPGATTVKVAE